MFEGGDEVAGDGGEEAGEDGGEDDEAEFLGGSEVHVEIGVADEQSGDAEGGAEEDGGELHPEFPAEGDGDLQGVHGALDLVRDAIARGDVVVHLIVLGVGERDGRFAEKHFAGGVRGGVGRIDEREIGGLGFAGEAAEKIPVERRVVEEDLRGGVDLAAELFDGEGIESASVTGGGEMDEVGLGLRDVWMSGGGSGCGCEVGGFCEG